MVLDVQAQAERVFKHIQDTVYATALKKKFYDHDPSDLECLAQIHGEISEVLEAFRIGNPPSEKIQGCTQAEEELIDALIRIFALSARRGFNLGRHIFSKMQINESRPEKHGKLM